MPDATIRFPVQPVQPGAYSTVDTSALAALPPGQEAPPIVAVIGDAKGGQPNVPLYFTTPQAARSVLRGGTAYDLARLALAGRAARVAVVRAGTGITQATKTLAATAGTPVTLTARDYGAWTNAIKVAVAANNVVTISFTDARGTTFTETFDCGTAATAQDAADTINGLKAVQASQYVTATAGAGTMPLTVATATAMTGGADNGALAAGDWTTALTALETEEVSIIVVGTGDATVHAQVQTHCANMSTVQARQERTQLAGGVAGETVVAVIARAKAVNQQRTQLVYPGVSLPDETGNLVKMPPFYLAAFLAGIHCSLPDEATALTHYRIPVIDVEKRLSTVQGSDLDQLLTAGVTPVAPAPGGGFWVVDSLTTAAIDPVFRDFHKVRSVDASQRRLRNRLEGRFVGGKSLDGTAGEIKLEAGAELDDQVTEQLIRRHAAVDVTADPLKPTRYLVTAPIVPVDTTKFVLITVALMPAGSTPAGAAA